MVTPETVQGTIQALISLGCPPIPVAPKQDPRKEWCHRVIPGKDGAKFCPIDENQNPIPRFTGKNPSYLRTKGNAYTCKHGEFQHRLPSGRETRKHFANPHTGIGTLGGHGGIVWLDFDAKNYDSQEDCDSDVETLISSYSLQDSWIERTGSGGWRIAVKPKQKPSFTNFSTTSNGKHVGEAISDGRFTVLAPTVHPNGNVYRRIGWGNPVEVESLEAIGIYPSKDEVDEAEHKQQREKHKTSDPQPQYPNSSQDNPWDIRNFAHYLESYSEMKDGWASARCPNHNGNSHTSFRVNLQTGQFKAWCGCPTKDVYSSALALAQSYGYQLPKVEKKQDENEPKEREKTSTPTDKENGIFKALTSLSKRHDGKNNIFITQICEKWLKGKLENYIKSGAINIIVAYKGCGKTEGVLPIISKANSVYAVFHLVALGKSASHNLGLAWHDERLATDSKIGVTAKSLWKLPPERLNRNDSVFFVDEIDAVLEQMMGKLGNSDGMRPVTLSVLEANLKATVYGGGAVILASADVTKKEIDYIRAITPREIPINIIWNTYQPDLPTIKEFKGDKPDLLVAELIRELEAIEWDEQGNPKWGIMVNDDLKGGIFGAKTIADYVRAKHPEWDSFIREITSETSGTPEGVEYLKNVNENSKTTLLLSCSPSVTAGFSIVNGHFEITYGLSNGIHTAKDFSQSLRRNRTCTDIRIWAAEKGFTYSGNRSLFPKYIKTWYFNNYQANARHLLSYKPEYNPLTNEWDSPHLEIKCKQEAYRNGCMKYLRLRVEQHLQQEGYKLEEYNPNELKPVAEVAVANLKTINFQNSIGENRAVAAKRLMTKDEYMATKESKDPDVIRERRKFLLHKTYGEELANVVTLELKRPNAEDKEDVEILEGYEALHHLDKSGWGNKLKLLYLLTHPDGKTIAAKMDLAPEAKQLKQLENQYIDGQRFAGDIKWNSRKLKALQYLKVVDYLKPGVFIKPTDRAKLVSRIRKHPELVNECFVWNISDKKDDGTIFRELIQERLGLKVLSKKVKGQDGRSQAIDPKYWEYFELFKNHQERMYSVDEDIQQVDEAWGKGKGSVTNSISFNANLPSDGTAQNPPNQDTVNTPAVSPYQDFEKLQRKLPTQAEALAWAVGQGLSPNEVNLLLPTLNKRQPREAKIGEFTNRILELSELTQTERALEFLKTVEDTKGLMKKLIEVYSEEVISDAIVFSDTYHRRQELRKMMDEILSTPTTKPVIEAAAKQDSVALNPSLQVGKPVIVRVDGERLDGVICEIVPERSERPYTVKVDGITIDLWLPENEIEARSVAMV